MSPYSELERLAMLLSGIMVMVFFVTPRESKYYYAFALLYSVGLLRLWDKFYFYNEVKRYIKTGDAVIDIGANLGYYTYIFSGLVGKEGTVYAIEPIKDFHNLLVNENVRVFDVALGKRNGTAFIEKWRDTNGAYRIADKGQPVNMRKGSELFKDLEKIDFIKIDVEGYEMNIIEDMIAILKKHKPKLLIETGSKDVLDLLHSIGYKIIDKKHNDYLFEERARG